MKKPLFAIIFFLSLLITDNRSPFTSAHAGGPFFVTNDGVPLKWSDDTLKWITDGGDLNANVTSLKAAEWIGGLFGIWGGSSLADQNGAAIDVADIDFEFAGTLPEDVNETNYIDIINDHRGEAVIVFDETGAIIDLELGEKASSYVVGFASPFSVGKDEFAGGIIVLNGLFIDGNKSNGVEVSEDEFRAAILHEIGHLLNLDHTQANIEAVKRVRDGDDSLIDEIPTMYPILFSKEQLVLHVDDVVSLAERYPAQGYLDSFCRVEGALEDTDGKGFQGADVVARAIDPLYQWEDIRTIVSGVMYPKGTKNGSYVLGGLVPGREYIVGYRGIDRSFTGGSSIAPYDPPRSGVVSAIISESIVACGRGGASYEIASSGKVESKDPLTANSSEDGSDGNGTFDTDATAPSGGCSLIPRSF
ncbi:MAG: hypothetical protein COV46_07060 [Deltaproteobacteria bacterium CG11_big_fil_rev_8_21_14_0_20_49_13]|nr:MAG: hypothetical protein COV46_07060 [Deltaproteobacteria bacterium CG11_big_fil_rev_8_21_14_0_20_49_13]